MPSITKLTMIILLFGEFLIVDKTLKKPRANLLISAANNSIHTDGHSALDSAFSFDFD